MLALSVSLCDWASGVGGGVVVVDVEAGMLDCGRCDGDADADGGVADCCGGVEKSINVVVEAAEV